MDRRDFMGVASGALLASLAGSALGNKSEKLFVPPRAIGVNCFDLFYGPLIGNRSARMAITRIRELRMQGVPFVRFSASPFWPNEWKLYISDRSRYFSFLDAAFEAAELNQIGLVPSLFWNPVSVSDRVGEPVSSWGRDGSATRAFMLEYVAAVVTRYRQSSALWFWEFGNEFNTYVDLPNATNWWPKVSVENGTPTTRSQRDLITSRDVIAAFRAFATEVKKLDPSHLVTTGTDLPRSNAHNLSQGRSQLDSQAEFRANLLRVTPDPADVISIHLYQKAEHAYFPSTTATFSDILSELALAGKDRKKHTFVGEFGVPQSANKTWERSEFARLLRSIISSKVNWAAMWVFDFAHQRDDWSVQLGGARAYQLELISDANESL